MTSYHSGTLPEANISINMHRPHVKAERRKYKRTLYWFGFIEILLGIGAFGTCVVGAVIASAHASESMLYASSGLWCGVVMMISGILGVKVSKQSSPLLIRANMTASILSSIFMAVMFMMSMFAALSGHHILLAIYVFLSIIASAGFILNIVHAAFCCATICCITPRVDFGYVQSSSGRPPIVRYMLVDGQQLVGYPGPPPVGQPPNLPSLLSPSAQQRYDRSKISEPSTPPPAYTSRENLNEGPSTSVAGVSSE